MHIAKTLKRNQVPFFPIEKGAGLISFLGFVLTLLIVGVVLIFFVFGQIIPPNKIGVRRNYFSFFGILEEGYGKRGLKSGLQWKVPGISSIILLPRDFQFIHMDPMEKSGDLNLPNLEIPTADGSKVRTDITLITRFFDSPGSSKTVGTNDLHKEIDPSSTDVPVVNQIERLHGGPNDLVNNYGSELGRQLDLFSKKAGDSLKRSLSALSTIDYYNPAMRERAALKSTEDINGLANHEGIELWSTLIRRYTYVEQNIDDQIFAKNLQDAMEHLNSALSELSKAKAATEDKKAFWDSQKIGVLKVDGDSKVRILLEEAKKYEDELVAKGDKLIEISKAEVEFQKNETLNSSGGKIFVARKMVPIIKSLQGGIISGIDPYDIDSWVKKLMGK